MPSLRNFPFSVTCSLIVFQLQHIILQQRLCLLQQIFLIAAAKVFSTSSNEIPHIVRKRVMTYSLYLSCEESCSSSRAAHSFAALLCKANCYSHSTCAFRHQKNVQRGQCPGKVSPSSRRYCSSKNIRVFRNLRIHNERTRHPLKFSPGSQNGHLQHHHPQVLSLLFQ
jgi:hypothetical protein